MRNFEHITATTFEEASQTLKSMPKSTVIAGGSDLLGVLKTSLLPEKPECVIDITRIPGAADIRENGGMLAIGALATLTDIAESELVKAKAPMVAEAAYSVASPLIRNFATIGGNLCQDVRCWFYRYPHIVGDRLLCSRKGGDTCYAIQGKNRYHSIFGGMKAHVSPCNSECPAGTDISAYMEQIRKGNVAGAAHIIMAVNPMPMCTSRVCAHTCQSTCNRCQNDEGMTVSSVERFVGDYILSHPDDFYTAPEQENGKRVAVVGAGPSGLSAAFYLRQAGNTVTVYDNQAEPGGMLMYAIPAYRLPKDIVRKVTGALAKMGITFVVNTNIGKDVKPADLEAKFDSVFYATGTWKRPVIGIAGEELTEFGLNFLVEVNRWMQSKIGSEVLVTGGGNVAMDVAITAKRLGAKTVKLACLESEDEMPASKEEVARAREEGIAIMAGWGLSRVVEEGGVVKGLEVKRCTSVFDGNHVFSPQYDESDKRIIPAESILMAVGQQADLSFLDAKYQVQLNRRGLIAIEAETGATSRKGIFAGGDATSGPATVVKAIATGHIAAHGMNRYLGVPDGGGCGKEDKDNTMFVTFDTEGIRKATAVKQKELDAKLRALDKEDSFTLTAEEALEEAKRCLNCACYAVNPSDMAPVLIALDAMIVTNKRTIPAEEFLCSKLKISSALQPDEIVTRVDIPVSTGAAMKYDKFRLREAIDFAIVSIASVCSTENGKFTGVRIVLGGVAPVPVRVREVEDFLIGKTLSTEVAEQAAEMSVANAFPMEDNKFKVQEVKVLLKRVLLQLA